MIGIRLFVLIDAAKVLGTRTQLASGLMFSMRIALKSPTRLPETL